VNLLKRLEILEAALLRQRGDLEYKIVRIEDGETYNQAITASGVTDWHIDRIIFISFVKADFSRQRGKEYYDFN
jgi:hypothetical protein